MQQQRRGGFSPPPSAITDAGGENPPLHCWSHLFLKGHHFSYPDQSPFGATATRNPTPEKARASNTAVVSLEFLIATALGMCRITTHRNIIKPERPPASFDVMGTMIPTPPAINA